MTEFEFITECPQMLAQRALTYQLYTPGGGLKRELELMAGHPHHAYVAIAQTLGVPVGVAMVTRMRDVQVYVHPQYRRQKLGSQLIAALQVESGLQPRELIACQGKDRAESMGFWRSQRIFVPEISIGGDTSLLSEDECIQLFRDALVFKLQEQGLDDHEMLDQLAESKAALKREKERKFQAAIAGRKS